MFSPATSFDNWAKTEDKEDKLGDDRDSWSVCSSISRTDTRTDLLLLSLLVGFLFGTSLQKLFGELFGFHSVP